MDFADAHDDLSGLDSEQLGVLDDWHKKLSAKYPKVGVLSAGSFDAGTTTARIAGGDAHVTPADEAVWKTVHAGADSEPKDRAASAGGNVDALTDDFDEWRTVGADS